jgi:alkanesulfonate monooxygenase SsuD/methylene tetrahydromethanopterin reductase-like flavin-dependent oxidoreductase (luciferase family)
MGRNAADIAVSLLIPAFLHEDLPTARQAAREFLIHYAGMSHYAKAFEASGFTAEMEGVRKGLAAGTPAAAMAALSDRLLDEVLLVGPAARCREQLEAFREAGVEWATLGPQRVGSQDLGQQARVVVTELAPR